MNIQLDLRMDKSEFLTWVQAHEGRYELVGSRVVMMTGGSRGHAILVRRLAAALEKRLDSSRWTVLTSDFGVDVGPSTVRYPDVVVDVAGGRFKDLTATAPVLIAESRTRPPRAAAGPPWRRSNFWSVQVAKRPCSQAPKVSEDSLAGSAGSPRCATT